MRRVATILLAFVILSMLQVQEAATQTSGICPALVRDALRRVEQLCTGTGRNQICYGHSILEAESRPEIGTMLLSMPGDITEIHNLSRIQLFPMDLDLEQWGVALMRVQANLPDALPGQNVLFMLFGDVELTPETEVTETETPMSVSAFRLRSGIGMPLCDSVPPDGLLIQTPHGVGRVELTINGVDLSIGSTVFFTAQENGYLTVSALEGAALVHTDEGESIALAGSEVQIPLDEDLQASAPPMLPQPYDEQTLLSLPLDALDRQVEVHPPLSPVEIEAIHQAIEDGVSRELLPENTPTATVRPTAECTGNACITPSRTATPRSDSGSGGQGTGSGGPATPARTNTSVPDAPEATMPPTLRPTDPPTSRPTDPPTARPTNPPTTRPTDPPPPTAVPPTAVPPTDPPPPTAVPPTDPPPPPPTDCPGRSCDAPGHGGSCPGNSCNAPGQNKRFSLTGITRQHSH